MTDTVVGFNHDAFRAAIAQKGMLRNNKFMVYFPLPNGFMNRQGLQYFDTAARDIAMWCDSAPIPGMAIQPTELRQYGYGSFDKRPTAAVFQDITLSFNTDAAAQDWYLFHAWNRMVVSFDARAGVTTTNGSFAGPTPYDPYEVGYKDDYATSIVVSTFDDAGNEAIRVVLREAYPINTSAINQDWGDANRVAKFQVTFNMMDWYVDTPGLTGADTGSQSILQQINAQIPTTPPTNQSIQTSSTRSLTA